MATKHVISQRDALYYLPGKSTPRVAIGLMSCWPSSQWLDWWTWRCNSSYIGAPKSSLTLSTNLVMGDGNKKKLTINWILFTCTYCYWLLPVKTIGSESSSSDHLLIVCGYWMEESRDQKKHNNSTGLPNRCRPNIVWRETGPGSRYECPRYYWKKWMTYTIVFERVGE